VQKEWGTFAVNDHVRAYPFVSDVLLYDRLVIPRKPANEPLDACGDDVGEWPAKWNPGRLDECLTELGDLALPIDWTCDIRRQFKLRNNQRKASGEARAYDPFYDTRLNLYNHPEIRAAAATGLVVPIAAYPSLTALRRDYGPLKRTPGDALETKPIPSNELASFVGHRLLAPAVQLGLGPREEQGFLEGERELLKRAIQLAKDARFQMERDQFRERESKVIAAIQGVTGSVIMDESKIKAALEDMATEIDKYNTFMADALKQHGIKTQEKFGFKLVEVGAPFALLILGLTTFNPLSVAIGLGGLAAPLISFVRHERKSDLPMARPGAAAAMFLSARPIVGKQTS